MPNPPNNNDLQREKMRFLHDSLSLQRVISRGSIANSSRDNVVAPVIPATPPPTASVTPTPSVTCTLTPTVSLTPTQTPPQSPTPTVTITPTVTPTVTITPTISITPTITPTISITPTITLTVTVTPSVTPNYSYITLQPLTGLGQDVYIGGITDESQYFPAYNFRDMNGLYRAINFNTIQDGGILTLLRKYQNNDYTTNLIGYSAAGTPFSWIHQIGNQGINIFPFISPAGLGNTASIPFSGYVSNDASTPYNAISGVQVYPDYKFSSLFARTSAVSAVIVRGLTGTAFNDTLSTVNGLVLNKSLYYGDIIQYEGYNSYYQVLLYYAVDIFANNYWLLEITPEDQTYIIGFSGAIGSSTQLPFSGLQMIGDYLANEFNFRTLSGQINQPNLQLLNANELYRNYPTPTPTPTITITPSVTPTVSITPTITPTISQTPTRTPTTTPTISITPTITPTISITPTITVTITPTRPTPTPTTTVRPDTFPFNTTNITVFGFYGNMEGVEYGISYDFSNTPVVLTKQAPPYDWVWLAYYAPYECNVVLLNSPVDSVWQLNLEQGGEYGFGGQNVATTTQSRSAIPVKNWTLSPGASGGIIILNG